MAVNGGHAGTKKAPNWGHVILRTLTVLLRRPTFGLTKDTNLLYAGQFCGKIDRTGRGLVVKRPGVLSKDENGP